MAEWLAANWQFIVALVGIAMWCARQQMGLAELRRENVEMKARITGTEAKHDATQVQLSDIRVALARIETTLAEMRRAG